MTTNPHSNRAGGGSPSVAEIAELTRRLRGLSAPGREVDEAERAAFLADKDALIARITNTTHSWGRTRAEGFAAGDLREALTDAVLARAADDGYVLVGPSARTWHRDPGTGRPTVAATDAEHQTVRDLMDRHRLDTNEPEWIAGPDGQDDIHTAVVPTRDGTGIDDASDIDPYEVGQAREAWLVDPAVAAGHPADDHAAAELVAAQEAVLDAFYTADAVQDDAEDAAAGGPWELHSHRSLANRVGAPAAYSAGYPGWPQTSAPGTDDAHDQVAGEDWWARARPADGDGPVVTFDGSGFYSDTAIAAIADAIDRGDTEQAAHLQDRGHALTDRSGTIADATDPDAVRQARRAVDGLSSDTTTTDRTASDSAGSGWTCTYAADQDANDIDGEGRR